MEIIIKDKDITLEDIKEFTEYMNDYFSTDFTAIIEVIENVTITTLNDR